MACSGHASLHCQAARSSRNTQEREKRQGKGHAGQSASGSCSLSGKACLPCRRQQLALLLVPRPPVCCAASKPAIQARSSTTPAGKQHVQHLLPSPSPRRPGPQAMSRLAGAQVGAVRVAAAFASASSRHAYDRWLPLGRGLVAVRARLPCLPHWGLDRNQAAVQGCPRPFVEAKSRTLKLARGGSATCVHKHGRRDGHRLRYGQPEGELDAAVQRKAACSMLCPHHLSQYAHRCCTRSTAQLFLNPASCSHSPAIPAFWQYTCTCRGWSPCCWNSRKT